MWEYGVVSFAFFEILQGEEWMAFNIGFTLVTIFGIYALTIGLLCKLLSRS